MLKSLLCLAARGVVRDTENNAISVFSIIEKMSAVGIPILIQELSVLAMFQKEAEDQSQFELTFEVKNNAEILLTSPFTVTFQHGLRNRSIVNVKALLVKEPGALNLSFRDTQEVLASYTIDIVAPDPQIVPQATDTDNTNQGT